MVSHGNLSSLWRTCCCVTYFIMYLGLFRLVAFRDRSPPPRPTPLFSPVFFGRGLPYVSCCRSCNWCPACISSYLLGTTVNLHASHLLVCLWVKCWRLFVSGWFCFWGRLVFRWGGVVWVALLLGALRGLGWLCLGGALGGCGVWCGFFILFVGLASPNCVPTVRHRIMHCLPS